MTVPWALAIPVIIFVGLIVPIWIMFHYVTVWIRMRSDKSAARTAENKDLRALARTAELLEQRLDSGNHPRRRRAELEEEMSKYERRERREHDSRDPYREQRKHREHRRDHGCGFGGLIHRVLDKSRELTGLPKGMVIAGYVLGFIFVPLLTTLVFLALLYWSSYPDDARRNADRVSRHARRAAHKMGAGLGQSAGPRPAAGPDIDDLAFDDVADVEPPRARRREPAGRQDDPRHERTAQGVDNAGDLRTRFEKLERRARAIEAFVASEEYRLQREFDKLGDTDRGSG